MKLKIIFPEVKALILDMDGVLWRGNQILTNLPELFEKIKTEGLSCIVTTNNSTLSQDSLIEKFFRLGVQLNSDQVINSAMATAEVLKKTFPGGGPVFVIGETGLTQSLEQKGFRIADEKVLAVIAGIDRNLTYNKISTAMRLINAGAAFYGTNPDRTFPMPDGMIPGAGTILAAIEAATDIPPIVIGKPHPFMLEIAIQKMGVLPEQTLVIGDRLDTDIAGGQTAGCKTALVLSGVTTTEQAKDWKPAPDIICDNITDLF